MNAKKTDNFGSMRVDDALDLSRTILLCSHRCVSRMSFLREVSQAIMDHSGCDAVEVRLSDGELQFRWDMMLRPEQRTNFELVRWAVAEGGLVIPVFPDDSDMERCCRRVACNDVDPSMSCFTENGSLLVGDAREPLLGADTSEQRGDETPGLDGDHRSLAVIRFRVDNDTVGLLHLKHEQPHFFTEEMVDLYGAIARTLGLAVAGWRAESALRERVKELSCLYGIARVVEQPGVTVQEMLQSIVELLPPSWQFPEIAEARILFDESSYATPGFRSSRHRQSAPIVIDGVHRGFVELVYLEERPEFSVAAFLPEEEHLIAAVSREISLIIERDLAEREHSRLQDQLIHADRLATIGQLAAGVAHELNEPLGSVLGFAQLVEKHPDLPDQVGQDIERIIRASLHGREVIRKLLMFSRQIQPNIVLVDLNQVIDDGLYFLEGKCTKANVEIVRHFADDLPEIKADPARLNQVLVNLAVNALQAMPIGGTLLLSTNTEDGLVVLTVTDTGTGMQEEIQDKIFLPFFTTKDVDEGTGLGLAVVHGIVAAHGGSIDVASQPGKGSQFTVRLPVGADKAGNKQAHDEGK